MKILVAEDDLHTRTGLIEVFESEGYETLAANNGREAIELFKTAEPQVVCLDVMMPDMNGYDACKEIRKIDSEVPILFISAKSEEIDKILGLELGADDFIVKPFGVKEVIARIRAVTRRVRSQTAQPEEDTSFIMKDLKVIPSELRVYREAETIELSIRDIQILKLLFENQGKVVSRDLLFDQCWGIDHIPNSRTLDQHISQLRKRIEKDPGHPQIIKTVHGAGYRFEDSGSLIF